MVVGGQAPNSKRRPTNGMLEPCLALPVVLQPRSDRPARQRAQRTPTFSTTPAQHSTTQHSTAPVPLPVLVSASPLPLLAVLPPPPPAAAAAAAARRAAPAALCSLLLGVWC